MRMRVRQRGPASWCNLDRTAPPTSTTIIGHGFVPHVSRNSGQGLKVRGQGSAETLGETCVFSPEGVAHGLLGQGKLLRVKALAHFVNADYSEALPDA